MAPTTRKPPTLPAAWRRIKELKAAQERTRKRARAAKRSAAVAADSKEIAYEDRTALLVALSTVWPSHLAVAAHNRKSTVLCIHTPKGQAAWMLYKHEVPYFPHLRRTANDWDGHTPDDRRTRLLQTAWRSDAERALDAALDSEGA